MREIDIYNQRENLKFSREKLKRFIRCLDEFLPENLRAPQGLLSIAIFDDEHIAKIHGDFLDKPTPTDVITFEGDGSDDNAGEICVGADTAFRECSRFGFSADKELCLYVAHGYLHLAGVDDISEEDALKMRAAEKEAIIILEKKFRTPIFNFNNI